MVGKSEIPFFKGDSVNKTSEPNYDLFECEYHYLQYANIKPIITQTLRTTSVDPMYDDYHIHKAQFGSICTLQAEETVTTAKSRIERLMEYINVSHLESDEEKAVFKALVAE